MNIEGWICTECNTWNSMFNGLCRRCDNIFISDSGCTDMMILEEYERRQQERH